MATLFSLINHDVKRIVKGSTFNARTVDVLASWDNDDYDEEKGRELRLQGYLVRNKSGIFYAYEECVYAVEIDGETETRTTKSVWQIDSAEEAMKLCAKSGADIIEEFSELPPEAEAAAPKTKDFVVRMPPELHEKLSKAAAKAGASMNETAIKCLQNCFADAA